MRPDLLIVGQGLAGTLLGWECERAGISFAVAEVENATPSASRVAAGLVNPITGRRLVKSWQIDVLLPAARTAYRELESAWGIAVWREMRMHRLFQDERERRIHAEKTARGEFAPFASVADATGFWIEQAARVDVKALLDAAAARWRAQGRWRIGPVDLRREFDGAELVVDCRGLAGAQDPIWSGVPWEFSKGETVVLAVEGLAADVIVNCGHWLLPVSPGVAWVGATHEPGTIDRETTTAARVALEASAVRLLDGEMFTITDQFAGVRVNLPDKRPVAGRHPSIARVGVLNGLGAKGVLLAPALARQWVHHLTEGVPFEAAVDVARFEKS